MGRARNFEFILHTRLFYPGQVVEGQVKFEVVEELQLKDLHVACKGDSYVRWTEGDGENSYTYSSTENYYHLRTASLAGTTSELRTIPVGIYSYSFNFQLPMNIPSSFEITEGKVRHRLLLLADGKYFKEIASEYPFTVLTVLDLNQVPEAARNVDGQGSKTVCCLCCESGPITANLMLDRMGYVPGEAIIIRSGSCENNSNRKCDQVRLNLNMITTLYAEGHTTRIGTVVANVHLDGVPEKGNQSLNGRRLVIPALPPTGLPGCKIIHIDYTLNYVIQPNGFSLPLGVFVNIVIGTVPLLHIAESYGVPPPLPVSAPTPLLSAAAVGNTPKITMPEDIPPPSYAESNFASVYNHSAAPPGRHTSVAPAPLTDEGGWKPSYTYYNWN